MLRAALLTVVVLLGMNVHAGRNCEVAQPTAERVERGMALAQRTSNALDASGTRVVLLARAGQDLRKYGLRWSHLGFAYRTPEGPWRVVHKLNQCGTASSALYRQGLGEFFLDDPWRYEAAWVEPLPAVQDRLMALLQGPTVDIARLHTPAYSLVAYAWGQKYQQSNQWVIETLAAAVEPDTVRNRARAQAWLQFKGYEPTALTLGPMARLGGRIGQANIAFDDHPNEKRFADRIETVTADSVFVWFQRAGMSGSMVILEK